MKRILIFILTASLLLLTGCNDDKPNDTAPSGTQEQTQGTTEGMDFSAYDNKATILCYNIYYKDVDQRAENIQDLMAAIASQRNIHIITEPGAQ